MTTDKVRIVVARIWIADRASNDGFCNKQGLRADRIGPDKRYRIAFYDTRFNNAPSMAHLFIQY